MKKLTPLFLSLLSLPSFSRAWGRITRLRRPRFLVKRVIKWYQRKYSIDMTEYEGEPVDYPCLVDFFTRRLNPDERPLVRDETVVVSPADGILSGMETIFADRAAQIKDKDYSISELIKENIDFSQGWHVATIYLSPANYHRYHYPLSGNISRYFHTGGRLFPVNHLGLKHVDELFVRNERIITEIVKNDLSCYIVAVGATFVGSIRMEFITGQKKKMLNRWEPVNLDIRQLEEMGRFEMGSTIVLVMPRKLVEPIENIVGTPVRVGQAIFKMLEL
jgi:phosphatidylserine decarboxylase